MRGVRKPGMWFVAIVATCGAGYFICGLLVSLFHGLFGWALESIRIHHTLPLLIAGRSLAGILCLLVAAAIWKTIIAERRGTQK